MSFTTPKYPLDRRNKVDGLRLLQTTPDDFSPLVFFDPQYRQVLDHLRYGNEGKRQKDRVKLAQMPDPLIRKFCREIARVLRPSGYVAVWADKFMVCNGLVPKFFEEHSMLPALQMVDMLTWDKGRIGMGYRTRRKGEYLVFMQRPPIAAKSTWRRKPCIGDVWPEKIENRVHVHQKPIRLQRAIIEATTRPGDVVMSPCAGSFSVMDAAHACDRHFLGGDLRGAP